MQQPSQYCPNIFGMKRKDKEDFHQHFSSVRTHDNRMEKNIISTYIGINEWERFFSGMTKFELLRQKTSQFVDQLLPRKVH